MTTADAQHSTIQQPSTDPCKVLVDAGLSPLVAHVSSFGLYRLWLAFQHINREQFNGQGWIPVYIPYTGLSVFGIDYSTRQVQRLIADGAGAYWTVADGKLFLTGYSALWELLTKRAIEQGRPDIAEAAQTTRRVYVDLSGALGNFTARLYAAWMGTRHRDGTLTASRRFLAELWNVDENTTRRWDKATGITAAENYAQYAGCHGGLLPDHAYPYIEGDGSQAWSWRIPNTYHAVVPQDHPHAGQRRKARKARNHILRTVQPLETIREGLLRTGRRYFVASNVVTVFKAINRHLRREGDVEAQHYGLLGQRRGKHSSVSIYECAEWQLGFSLTTLQRDFEPERLAAFKGYRAGMTDHLRGGFPVYLPATKMSGSKYVQVSDSPMVTPATVQTAHAAQVFEAQCAAEADPERLITRLDQLQPGTVDALLAVDFLAELGAVLKPIGNQPTRQWRKSTAYNPAVVERKFVTDALARLDELHQSGTMSKTRHAAYLRWMGKHPGKARSVVQADELPTEPAALWAKKSKRNREARP